MPCPIRFAFRCHQVRRIVSVHSFRLEDLEREFMGKIAAVEQQYVPRVLHTFQTDVGNLSDGRVRSRGGVGGGCRATRICVTVRGRHACNRV